MSLKEGIMLQILILCACVLIIGVGYCAMQLEKIVLGDKVKKYSGLSIFLIMLILACLFSYLSIIQSQEITKLTGF